MRGEGGIGRCEMKLTRDVRLEVVPVVNWKRLEERNMTEEEERRNNEDERRWGGGKDGRIVGIFGSV